MSRIGLAFRSFFAILFSGKLPADIALEFGFSPQKKAPPAAKPTPAARIPQPSDGALQILGILQRDSRLIDFLMEDISAYSDDQVGAAVRDLHQQCRDSLGRYLRLEQGRSRIRPGADCDAAASLLLGSCFQYAFLRCFAQLPPDLDAAQAHATAIVTTLLAGLQPA